MRRLREGAAPDDPDLAVVARLAGGVRPLRRPEAERQAGWRALAAAPRERPWHRRAPAVAAVGLLLVSTVAAGGIVGTRWVLRPAVTREAGPAASEHPTKRRGARVASAPASAPVAAPASAPASAPVATPGSVPAVPPPTREPALVATPAAARPTTLATPSASSAWTESARRPTEAARTAPAAAASARPAPGATAETARPPAPPSGAAPDSELVLAALAALRRDHAPARADGLLAEYLRLHPDGQLAEDALALAIEAAAARGPAAAASAARRYLARFPDGRFRTTARDAITRAADSGNID